MTERSLIVDDNEDAVELLAEMFVARGYVVRPAFDGPTALRVAQDFLPQVALPNIGLRPMDDHELGAQRRDTRVSGTR
jgi:DNA-binding response OmpR family regulator